MDQCPSSPLHAIIIGYDLRCPFFCLQSGMTVEDNERIVPRAGALNIL
jgi:hypothetical protein